MQTFRTYIKSHWYLVIAAIVLIACIFGFSALPSKSQAQAGPQAGKVTGTLWSWNIGDIYMSGANHSVGITLNTTGSKGYFSGYAWSPNIGWVSFNSSDLGPCGSSSAPEIDFGTGSVSGYARALAGGTAQSGGWDGCISIRGNSPVHGVSYNAQTGAFSGLSWGYSAGNPDASVIGFVDWQGASFSKSAVDLKVNGQDAYAMAAAGGPVTLSWTGSGTTACNALGDWSGLKTAPSGTQQVTVAANTTNAQVTRAYTISCSSSTGAVSDTVNVTLPPVNSNFFSLLVNGTTSANVVAGSSATLSWQVQNLSSCSASGDWSGSRTASPNGTYNFVVTNITTNKSFTMTCAGAGGTLTPQTVTVTVLQPSCAVIPASLVIAAPASPATVTNAIKKFGIQWQNASGFPSTAITATAPSGISASVSGSPVTSALVPATITVNATSPVTSSRTISISGVPGSSAPAVSCTPALLYIVPPGFCQDPLALNVGQQGACQYPPGVKPFTKAPPWEEF